MSLNAPVPNTVLSILNESTDDDIQAAIRASLVSFQQDDANGNNHDISVIDEDAELAMALKLSAEMYQSTEQDDIKAQGYNEECIGIIIKKQSQKYHISTSLVATNDGCKLKQLILKLPLPITNIYQTVNNVRINGIPLNEKQLLTDSGITILLTKHCQNDRYIRFDVPKILFPAKDQQSISLDLEYDIILNEITTKFNEIKKIYDYNKQSLIYKLFTKQKDGEFIDCSDVRIQSIGDELWRKSNGNIIEYARKCYEYCGNKNNFQYVGKKKITKMKNLNDIMEFCGGECDDISTMWVNLMRYKYIPARHLCGKRPLDASVHVWSEFYLEKYGWIPVDCTLKLLWGGDYFGRIKLEYNAIIMHSDINLELFKKNENDIYHITHMQNYMWWYFYSSRDNKKSKCTDKMEFKGCKI